MKLTFYLLTLAILLACGQTNKESEYKAENDPAEDSTESDTLEEIDGLGGDDINDEDILDVGDITKAFVSLSTGDSTIQLIANIRQDHRIFGYAKPDTLSERLLLLSVFTEDVENNPLKCKLGAYYETSGMKDLILKYVTTQDGYVVAHAIDKSDNKTRIYFEKKWIEFE